MGVEEREGPGRSPSGVRVLPGGANPPMNDSEDPLGTGGGKMFSDCDGFRREEDGVLLRGGPSLDGVGPREGCRAMASSPRGRSEREERESRSLPSERL